MDVKMQPIVPYVLNTMDSSRTNVQDEASTPTLQKENEVSSSQTVIESDIGGPPSRQGNEQRRTSKFKKCFFIATPLLLATVLLIALYAGGLVTSKEEKEEQASLPVPVCGTEDCVRAADLMISKMNLSAKPCNDFNEFACGRFNKEAPLPVANPMILLTDSNKQVLRGIVEEPMKPGEPMYLTNMKRYYKSCIDETQIEEMGVTEFLSEKTFIDAWPTLNPAWSESSFNLNDLLERHATVLIQPLFSFGVAVDVMNATRKLIKISEPELGLPKAYFLNARNLLPLMAYENLLSNTAIVLGSSRVVAEQDSRHLVDLEIELAKILVFDSEREDSSTLYNPVKLSDLALMYPQIDIPRTIRAAFNTANVTLPDDELVINEVPTYLGNLSVFIFNTSKRDVQNIFGFRYAQNRVSGLTKRLRNIEREFEVITTATLSSSPRWSDCLQDVTSIFWKGIAKQFVARNFTDASKAHVAKMVDNLVNAFKQMLTDNPWMEQATKDEARKKLAALTRKIGYPEVGFKDADIERAYKDYVMQENNYYANRIQGKHMINIEMLRDYQRQFNKDEWILYPFDVDGRYNPLLNEIIIPAGILRPPFFSVNFQDFLNYGSIGAVIAHEIIHGFDGEGSQIDAHGNKRDWWGKDDTITFLRKSSCFVSQFSKFYLPEINKNVVGSRVQGESIADSDGLRISFRAYKKLSSTGEQPVHLPGLDLTPDQLFFLAFAQTWCLKTTTGNLMFTSTVDSRAPSKYRIIGSLQNSEDFAEAYNCPARSNMNPTKKCTIW